jgi:hypothetical protein
VCFQFTIVVVMPNPSQCCFCPAFISTSEVEVSPVSDFEKSHEIMMGIIRYFLLFALFVRWVFVCDGVWVRTFVIVQLFGGLRK